MEIEKKRLDEIHPYAGNAKLHPAEQVEQIKKSIEQFGNNDPIAIDEDGIIIEGHGRYLALKELGYDEAEVIVLKGMTEDEKNAYRLVHNQLTMNSGFDLELLQEELEKIDIDLGEYDISVEDLEIEEEKPIEEDEPPEVDDENPPQSVRGGLYKLGNHFLMCGDSTKEEDVRKLMSASGETVLADFVLSDPPYGMNLDTDFSEIHGSLGSIGRKNNTRGNKYEKVIGDNDDFSPELISTFFENFGYVDEMFLFGADYFAELLPNKNEGSWLCWDKRKENQAEAIGSEFELIWSKKKHKRRMLRHDWFGFLSSQNSYDARHRVHPTQKPISLLSDIISQWGDKAKIIIDLYGGSGSTLIACEQLGRKCYTMELSEKYCDVIIKRWENLTGLKAEKIA